MHDPSQALKSLFWRNQSWFHKTQISNACSSKKLAFQVTDELETQPINSLKARLAALREPFTSKTKAVSNVLIEEHFCISQELALNASVSLTFWKRLICDSWFHHLSPHFFCYNILDLLSWPFKLLSSCSEEQSMGPCALTCNAAERHSKKSHNSRR